MQSEEKICLQWNDFKDNVSSAFGQLRGDWELSDVTLACEDGQQIEAHKVILASSSPFFMQLLGKNKHGHPLIYMRGVKFEDLASIVDFLYLGEADVNQERLDDFLALAEEWELKGLTGRNEADDENHVKPSSNQKPKMEEKRSFHLPEASTNTDIRTKEIVSVTNVNVDLEELDEKINTMMNSTGKIDQKSHRIFSYNICGHEGPRAHLKTHVEANHITGVNHSCEICGKTARSRNALRTHKYSNHAKVHESQN